MMKTISTWALTGITKESRKMDSDYRIHKKMTIVLWLASMIAGIVNLKSHYIDPMTTTQYSVSYFESGFVSGGAFTTLYCLLGQIFESLLKPAGFFRYAVVITLLFNLLLLILCLYFFNRVTDKYKSQACLFMTISLMLIASTSFSYKCVGRLDLIQMIVLFLEVIIIYRGKLLGFVPVLTLVNSLICDRNSIFIILLPVILLYIDIKTRSKHRTKHRVGYMKGILILSVLFAIGPMIIFTLLGDKQNIWQTLSENSLKLNENGLNDFVYLEWVSKFGHANSHYYASPSERYMSLLSFVIYMIPYISIVINFTYFILKVTRRKTVYILAFMISFIPPAIAGLINGNLTITIVWMVMNYLIIFLYFSAKGQKTFMYALHKMPLDIKNCVPIVICIGIMTMGGYDNFVNLMLRYMR